MDLLQLKYFCDAAKSENFSKTAAKYLVPPSNISQTVSRLERELGTKLFDRGHNSVVLNERGKAFYKRVSRALSLIDDAEREVKDGAAKREEIKLVVCSNRRIVTEAIELFLTERPHVSFSISHRSDDIDDSVDIVISDDISLKSRYRGEALVNERLLLAVNKASPIAKLTRVGADELLHERFISLSEGSSLDRASRSALNELGIEPGVVIRVDDPYYLRKYVSLGLGVAIVPEFSFRAQWEENVALLELGDFSRVTFIFTKQDRYVSRAAREFSALLANLAESENATPPAQQNRAQI